MKAELNLRRGSSLITERGTDAFTYTVEGLPKGQEARILNDGDEKRPDWHFHWRPKADGEMVKDQTRYKTAEEALAALQCEFEPKHAYWGFKCKTPTCNWWHAMQYVGIHDGRPIYALPDVMPGWFDWQCDGCGKAYRYNRNELQIQRAAGPPPPEFVDRF